MLLDKLISKFIWQSKRPRIRPKTLLLPKDKGALVPPNLKHSYWAAQLTAAAARIRKDEGTRWEQNRTQSRECLQQCQWLATQNSSLPYGIVVLDVGLTRTFIHSINLLSAPIDSSSVVVMLSPSEFSEKVWTRLLTVCRY